MICTGSDILSEPKSLFLFGLRAERKVQRMKKRNLFLLVVLLVVVLGSILVFRARRGPLNVPVGESVQLYVYDGQRMQSKFLYEKDDLNRLRDALSRASARPLEYGQLPEDSFPLYALRVNGTKEDFEAVCVGDVWLDNRGRVLETDLELGELMDQMGAPLETSESLAALPCRRTLALLSGNWDARFLLPAKEHTQQKDVIMSLVCSESGDLSWTVENHTGRSLSHGNGGYASLEVLLENSWHSLPWVPGSHYGVTDEEYILEPGECFSDDLSWEPYGDHLPDGIYRLSFPFYSFEEGETTVTWAWARFQMEDGVARLEPEN